MTGGVNCGRTNAHVNGLNLQEIDRLEKENSALKAKLKNREDILIAFAIAADLEDTELARGIVAVVKAALKEAP